MKEENMRFGQFIRAKRQADNRQLTLKDISEELGLSLSMLSDIEKGRRSPFNSEKIEKFSRFLNLSSQDKARLYDLAAIEKSEVPSDIEDVMMYTPSGSMARMALRMTNDGLADEEDWKDFIRKLEKKRRQSND